MPEVECTGEGMWIVTANANCSLEDVNYLESWPPKIRKEQLLPPDPPEAKLEDEILMVQVTEFACGGFTVGMRFSHLVFDGLGYVQFLKAVAEIARGFPEPTVTPVWLREYISNPVKLPRSTIDSHHYFNLATSVVDISQESINRTKDLYMAAKGQPSSTFEVVTAMIIKCRVRAINLLPGAELLLACGASTRQLLHDHGILPAIEGYYGNCMSIIFVSKSCEEIGNASLVEIMSLIQEGKKLFRTKFKDWKYGHNMESLHNISWGYGTMTVSDWSKIGLNDVDFGWGPPKYVFPVSNILRSAPMAIYVKPPLPKTGIRLILWCVTEEHSALFCEELMRFG